MTADEKRSAVIAQYKKILGRNLYSQTKRQYVFTKASDGKYYSDCSSSVSAAYKQAGIDYGLPNTVGMYTSKKMVDVPVTIGSDGVIKNPEILKIGDILLFAGTDSSRSASGYVGHVEMLAIINNGKYTIYGHGSGTPRATEMNAYCKKRRNTKSSTKLGHRGLIKVRRIITDDDDINTSVDGEVKTFVAPGTWNLRTGPGTEYDKCGVLSGGTAVDIVAKLVGIDKWVFVKSGNMIGFLSTSAIKGEL